MWSPTWPATDGGGAALRLHTNSRARPVLLIVLLSLVLLAASASHAAADEVTTEAAELDSLLVSAARAIGAGELEAARGLCEQALDISSEAHEAQRCLAIIALHEDDPDEAVKRAKKAVKGEGDNVEYRMTLADAYGAKAMQGGLRAALYGGRYREQLEEVLKLDPSHINANFGLLYYSIYAPSIAGGGMDRARERAGIIATVDEYYGHLAHAVIAKREDDFVAAGREYAAAAEVDAENPEGWYLLGTFFLDTERPLEAVAPFERALELAPDDLVTVYQLAKAHYESGDDLAAAEAGFRAYIAADERPKEPAVASAHWRLGLVHEGQGRDDDAMLEYDTALGLDAEHTLAREAKDALEARLSGEAASGE